MWKALTLVLLAAALATPTAQAQESTVDRIILQELARTAAAQKSIVDRPNLQELTGKAAEAEPTLGERIVAQERGRRVVGLLDPAPVQVVGDPDRFDFADAGIGGAVALALALMAAACVAVWNTGRRRTA
jgi:hypothetical protein